MPSPFRLAASPSRPDPKIPGTLYAACRKVVLYPPTPRPFDGGDDALPAADEPLRRARRRSMQDARLYFHEPYGVVICVRYESAVVLDTPNSIDRYLRGEPYRLKGTSLALVRSLIR